MSFLKTLFWIVVAVIVALFCFNNWTVVGINLWNGLILETKLPLLLGIFFLVGFIPPLLLWQAARYRLRRRMMSETGVIVAPAQVEPRGTVTAPTGPITTMPPGGA